MEHEHAHDRKQQPRWSGWVFWAFLAIAAFFLFTEHRAHVLGALPWLLLLACPFLHFFMHRNHRGGHRHG